MRTSTASDTNFHAAAPCPAPKARRRKKADSSSAGMKNKYASRSKISEAKVRQIVKLFALDLNALQIASLACVNRNTVNRYLAAFRERIARFCEAKSSIKGIELNEASPLCQEDEEKNENAKNKSIVFGLFKRDDGIYTEIVPDSEKATLLDILKGRVTLESVMHSNNWRGYDGLVDLVKQKYVRIEQNKTESGKKRPAVNGTESFWSYTKTRLLQFRGIKNKSLYLHMKECEFRYNHRNEDIYALVLKMLRDEPLASATLSLAA